MGGICKVKGKERGLRYEIKVLEDMITRNKAPQNQLDYAKLLVKSYKKYSEADYNAGINPESHVDNSVRAKSERVKGVKHGDAPTQHKGGLK